MYGEAADALKTAQADANVRVVVITGEGNCFTAGNDLKDFLEVPPTNEDAEVFQFMFALSAFTKPVIAAVNGLALGGGFEMVLACDIAIASEHASFALPEPRVGLAALAGGLHRLPRQIGLKPAMGMLLTGRRVGAQEALALGIVNEVVPPAELMSAARRWADQICECSPVSIRTTRSVVNEGLEHASLEEAMRARYPAIVELVKSEDFIEGPRAFAAKRKPNWKGK